MSPLQTSLADLATTIPSSTRVFLRHRLDFCCGGKRSLVEACGEAKLDPQRVFDEINAESTRDTVTQRSWVDCPLGDIIDRIVQHYHASLRTDLPLLIDLARKVEGGHEKRQACPRGLADVLAAMLADLELHMRKEELILFPLIRDGRGSDVGIPISVLEREHLKHGAELQRIRRLTGDLVIPEEACRSWRALYDGLTRLETDLLEHIHLENNILFRRALAA